MKKVALFFTAAVSISACATKPIDTATARSTPQERIYAPELVAPSDDKVQLLLPATLALSAVAA